MNTLLIVSCGCIFLCHETISAKFTALSDSPYTIKLYLQVRNTVFPSDSDPAKSDARIRQQICRDIFDSRWFRASNGHLLEPDDVYHNRDRSLNYARAFRELYAPDTHEDTNTYHRRILPFYNYRFREYAFLCPVKFPNTMLGIELYAVTKEYNVSPVQECYKAGRFITPRKMRLVGLTFQPILAEEPARVYIGSSKVDLERHYRRTRDRVEPAPNSEIDPLCRLISDDKADSNNQHFRLCAAVLRSSDFESIMYPVRNPNRCLLQEVSFRADDVAMRDTAAGKRYYERMTRCYSDDAAGGETYLHVSRAYRSNQVFVYSPTDEHASLKDPSNTSVLSHLKQSSGDRISLRFSGIRKNAEEIFGVLCGMVGNAYARQA